METLLSCVFPGCEVKSAPDKASVPELDAVRQAERKTALAAADLVRHVHCQVHANLARRSGVKMFSYLGTVQEMERRVREREAAKSHFAQYAIPKQETAMGAALQKAGVTGQNGKAAAAPA